MTEFLTCEAGGELSLQKARRLTEEEKKDYVPECAESQFIGTSNHIVLEELHYSDVRKVIPKDKESDGSFISCDPVYIITQEEWDALIALNQKLKNERLIKKVKSDIEWHEQFIARCEESKSMDDCTQRKKQLFKEKGIMIFIMMVARVLSHISILSMNMNEQG